MLLLALVVLAGCGGSAVSVTVQRAAVKHRAQHKAGAVNAIPLSQKGATNGVATLDGSKHLTQKQLLTGGAAGECLQRKATEELQWGACGSGGGKSQVEIEAFAATRNLSNVNTAAEARTSLGLGTAATKAEGSFVAGTSGKTTSASFGAGTLEEAALATGAVGTAKLAGEAVTGGTTSASKIAKETVQAFNLAAEAVTSAKLAANAVKAAAIEAGAVTEAKLYTAGQEKLGAVPSGGTTGQALVKESGTSYKTRLETITGTLGAESVLTANLAKEAVTEAKLAPGVIAAEESKTINAAVTKLNVATKNVFVLTLNHLTATQEVELEGAPSRPVEVLILFKQDATGGVTLNFKGVKWVGSAPTFVTTANAENLASLVVLGAKNTEPYGLSGPEGKTGPTGPTGPEGKETKHFTTPIGFAVPGVVKNGETFPGVFWPALSTGQKDKLLKEKCKTTKGEITVNFRKEGTEIAGLKKAVSSTASEASPGSTTEPASGDYIDLSVSAEASTPENLSCSLTVEHVVEK